MVCFDVIKSYASIMHRAIYSGDLIGSEDLMEILRCFCADNSVAIETRLSVLTIMEQVCVSTSGQFVCL